MRSDQEREGVLPEAPADGAAEPAGYDRPAVSPAADMTAEPEMGEGAPAVEAEAAGPEAVEEASAAPEAAAEAADPNAEETAEPNAAEANAAEPEAGEERVKARPSVGSIIGTVLLAVLCVILIPLLAVNITLIVKGALYPDELTDVFNIAPVAIDNPYMEGENEGCFNKGALVFIKTFDTDEERQAVKQGDVVAFPGWRTTAPSTSPCTASSASRGTRRPASSRPSPCGRTTFPRARAPHPSPWRSGMSWASSTAASIIWARSPCS